MVSFARITFSEERLICFCILLRSWQQIGHVLSTLLCCLNLEVEFVSLELYYDLSDCSFEVQTGQQCSVVFFCELLLTQLYANYRLEFESDSSVFEDHIPVNKIELHLVQLLDADRC